MRLRERGREVARVAFDQQSGEVRASGALRVLRGTGMAAEHPRGRRVTVRLALRAGRALAGRRLTADVVAQDDSGGVQRLRRAAMVRVRGRRP